MSDHQAYQSLWDDVTKQFLSHSSLTVMSHAMAAIRHFMDATSLSNANSTKILEFEDELSSALRDAVAKREEIEVASFTEDEVLSLAALCTRLATFAGTRDLTAWMEEDEGGKQSSAWDIISALAERGRLGYKEEETVCILSDWSERVWLTMTALRWLNRLSICLLYISYGKGKD